MPSALDVPALGSSVLDPNDLRALLQDEITRYWDYTQYEAVLGREREEREHLRALAEGQA